MPRKSLRKYIAAAAAAGTISVMAAAGAAAEPAASDWFVSKQATARLISSTETVGNTKNLKLGLQFKLQPGWKVYWRTPGDAGFPPKMTWQGSENLAGAEMGWPAPKRFEVLGFQTMGYKKEVVYPITAEIVEAGKPVRLRSRLSFLTCDDICIPYTTDLSLDLPAGDGKPSEFFQVISRFDSRIPTDGSAIGLTVQKAEIAGPLGALKNGARDGILRIVVKSQVAFKSPDIFVEGMPDAVFSKPKVTIADAGKTAILRVPVSVDEGFKLAGRDLRFTVIDGDRSVDNTVPVTAGVAGAIAGETGTYVTLPLMLGLALLGGLILNLMPCVLPVLSLKLIGVVKHGGGDTAEVRTSFIATSAGIIFSFLVLAGGLVGLKFAGAAVGWGIQFQHPWFLVSLVLLVSMFAYNMWGIFEVQLPSRLTGLIGSPGQSSGIAGNFGTGAFATLLATPCSAPFLGTAVGFALSRGGGDTFAIFAALGVGMATPFLLVAAVPTLATRLPKPGPWMNRLKQIMGVALAATAVWLLSILAVQVSLTAATVVGAIMLVIGAVLIGRRVIRESRRWVTVAAIVLLAVGSYITPGQFAHSGTGPGIKVAQDHWQPFDEAAIPELVAQGKTVFVDVTAEWCITCQVNKAAVLNRGEVFKLLNSDNVVAMKADWTRPSKVISAYLAKFGKFGIPFNIVYGPGAPGGVVLPELLTKGIVLAAFGEATPGNLAKN